MEFSTARLIYFSPTGTTGKVVDAVLKGIGIKESTTVNITHPEIRKAKPAEITEDIVIIGVPVYFGRIPQLAYDYLIRLQGNNKPVVMIAIYGNRDFGDTLIELKQISAQVGLRLIGAAAFIGEHAFSTDNLSIAPDRPDEHDLRKAQDFGQEIRRKILSADKIEEIPEPEVPGKLPLKQRPKDIFACVAQRDEQICSECGLCARNCPAGAINKDTLAVDQQLCIHCCACIKGCPQNARKMHNTKFKMASLMLAKTCKDRKEPVFF